MYDYEKMERDIIRCQRKYGEGFRVDCFGESYDGRILYAIRIGATKPMSRILLTAGIHGREWMNCRLLMEKAKSMAKRAKKDILREYVICPMLNPDGVSISQKGMAAVRNDKYKKHLERFDDKLARYRGNARGVDLNRNFPCGFKEGEKNGAFPASERETKAIMNYIQSFSNIRSAIHYHSSGEEIYYDYHVEGKLRGQLIKLANIYEQQTGYRAVKGTEDTIPNGGLGEWCVHEKGIPSITIETGKRPCPLGWWEWYFLKHC